MIKQNVFFIIFLIALLSVSLVFGIPGFMSPSGKLYQTIQTHSEFNQEDIVPGRLIIKTNEGVINLNGVEKTSLSGNIISDPNLLESLQRNQVYEIDDIFFKRKDKDFEALDDYYLLKFPEHFNSEQLAETLKKHSGVIAAFPDIYLKWSQIPQQSTVLDPSPTDDPLFYQQWGLHNTGQTGGLPDADVDAPEAWILASGGSEVIVTNLEYFFCDHPDLINQLWHNPGEIPNNGIDDDKNGYIDDVIGWDFYENDNDPCNDITFHGTGTAGTAAAQTNNLLGIAGMCSNCKIMVIGPKTGSDLLYAMVYVADNGGRVTIHTYQTTFMYSNPYVHTALEAALDYAYSKGVINVGAAGNQGSSHPQHNGVFNSIIAVSGTTNMDSHTYSSNYGWWNDVAAPSDNILLTTCYSGPDYCDPSGYIIADGTSFAAPLVGGIVATILSKYPLLTSEEIFSIMKSSVDEPKPISPGQNYYIGTGRINSHEAMTRAKYRTVASISIPGLYKFDKYNMWGNPYKHFYGTIGDTILPIGGSAKGPYFTYYVLEYATGPDKYAQGDAYDVDWIELHLSTTPVTGRIYNLDTSVLPKGMIMLRLKVYDTSGKFAQDRAFFLHV